LTVVGNEFDLLTPAARDWWLGTVLNFFQHVASLPIAAFLGILCDRVDRITLFSLITFVVGVCSILTSLCTSFTELAIIRFLTGGCYMGSVVVCFSIASDLFESSRRNAACAALAAAMGTGVLIGQVSERSEFLLRDAGVATPKISITNNFGSETNGSLPFSRGAACGGDVR